MLIYFPEFSPSFTQGEFRKETVEKSKILLKNIEKETKI